MSQRKTEKASRRWPRWIRAGIVVLLCLGLIALGLLLPQGLSGWIDRQFNRTIQLGEPSNTAGPLSFLERMNMLTDSNAFNYYLEIEGTRDAQTAFQDGMNAVEQLNQAANLPYFDMEIAAWCESISGFDEEKGKPFPTTNLVLNRSSGQGGVFWYISAYLETDASKSCNLTIDDETGKMMQYHYYSENLEFSVYPSMVSDLAVGLSDYWGLEVLECQEMVDSSGDSVSPGWIVLSDETGSVVQVVVDAGPNYLSINQFELDNMSGYGQLERGVYPAMAH